MDAKHGVEAYLPRPLWGLFAMLFVEIMGAALTIPIFTYFCIVELKLSATYVGLVMSFFSFAQLLGAPIIGRLSDACGRRPCLLACFLWTALCFTATAAVHTFGELLIVRTLAGLSGGSIPITQAMVMDASSAEQRSWVLGVMGAILGVAFTLGPAIMVLVLSFIDIERRFTFLAAAGFALCGCFVGACVLQETLPEEKRRPLCASTGDAAEALPLVAPGKRANAEVASPTKHYGVLMEVWEICTLGLCCIWVARFCITFAFLCLFTTYAFLIRDAFRWSDREFGLVLASCGLLGAAVQLLLYPPMSKCLGKYMSCAVGCVIVSVYFAVLPVVTLLTPSPLAHLLCQVIFTIGSSVVDPALPDLVGCNAPEDRMGLAQGLTNAFRSLASVLAPLLAGRAYDVSPYLTYGLAGTCALMASACVSIPPMLQKSEGGCATDPTEVQPLVKK